MCASERMPAERKPGDEMDVMRTLVIIEHISLVISTTVMGLAHAHRIMREVDIAVIA